MKNIAMRRTVRLFLTITLVSIIAISAGAGAVAAQEGRPCNLGYIELTCYDNEEPPAEQPPAEQPPAEQPPAGEPEQPPDDSLVSLQELLEAGVFEEDMANTLIADAREKVNNSPGMQPRTIEVNVGGDRQGEVQLDPQTGDILIDFTTLYNLGIGDFTGSAETPEY